MARKKYNNIRFEVRTESGEKWALIAEDNRDAAHKACASSYQKRIHGPATVLNTQTGEEFSGVFSASRSTPSCFPQFY